MIYTLPEDYDMPSGDGRPMHPPLLRCTECAWTGELRGAIDHYRATAHPITAKGVVQDLSSYGEPTRGAA